MIKPLMQISPMTKMVASDGKVTVVFNETIEFEFVYQTSQLTVYIPAPKGNTVPRIIYDFLTLTPEEHESVLTFISKYFELNHKEIVREMIDGKSNVPIRPTIF